MAHVPLLPLLLSRLCCHHPSFLRLGRWTSPQPTGSQGRCPHPLQGDASGFGETEGEACWVPRGGSSLPSWRFLEGLDLLEVLWQPSCERERRFSTRPRAWLSGETREPGLQWHCWAPEQPS